MGEAFRADVFRKETTQCLPANRPEFGSQQNDPISQDARERSSTHSCSMIHITSRIMCSSMETTHDSECSRSPRADNAKRSHQPNTATTVASRQPFGDCSSHRDSICCANHVSSTGSHPSTSRPDPDHANNHRHPQGQDRTSTDRLHTRRALQTTSRIHPTVHRIQQRSRLDSSGRPRERSDRLHASRIQGQDHLLTNHYPPNTDTEQPGRKPPCSA